MPHRFLPETVWKKKTQEDPNGYRRYFRIGRFSWFDKPEGEGCFEKFFTLNYYAFWASTPCIMMYYVAFKKIRNPLGVAYYYGRCAWPFHAAASTFSVAACGLCSYRGKDVPGNWGIAGALAGAMPGLGMRNYIIRQNRYGNGMWFFSVPMGMVFFGLAMYVMKQNNPKFMLDEWLIIDEKYQFNPEKQAKYYENYTMPNERFHLDFMNGGRGKDWPWSFVGEKWEHRLLMNKQEYGYLEGELDKVPAIEKEIHNRI